MSVSYWLKGPTIGLKIGQQNVGNCIAAVNQLYVDLKDYDLIAIQEPYLAKPGKVGGFPMSLPLISGHTNPKTAWIIVNTKIPFLVVHKSENLVAITIEQEKGKMLLVSCYFPPNCEIDPKIVELEQLLTNYTNFPTIIIGDLNARSPHWGDTLQNHRGQCLLDFILQNDIDIQNEIDSDPTFRNAMGRSWIDITLTRNMQQFQTLWTLEERATATDHRRTLIEIDTNIRPQIGPKRYTTKNVKWLKLRELLWEDIGTLDKDWLERQDLNEAVCTITAKVRAACEKVAKVSTSQKKTVPWWTANLSNQRRKVQAARRRFQRCYWDDNIRKKLEIQYRKTQAEYKKTIRRSKWENWKEYLSNINPQNPFGTCYQIARNKRNGRLQLASITKADQTKTKEIGETIQELLNYHFPSDCESDDDTCHTEIRHFNSNLGANDSLFTSTEIDHAFNTMNKGKAPGEDGLGLDIIYELYIANKELFQNILNKCLSEGKFPQVWKNALLVLFNKHGRDQSSPSGYRPICLLTAWSKVLDRLLTSRLQYFLRSKKHMNQRQYGFTPGRGAEEAVATLIETIRSFNKKGLHACMISLDVKSAFNHV